MAGETPSVGAQITLDKPRTVRFTIGAVRRIIVEKGRGYFEVEDKEEDELERLVYLACQGFRHEDPELTPEVLEEIIDFRQVVELGACIAEALGQDVPKAMARIEGDASGKPRPPKGARRTRPPRKK